MVRAPLHFHGRIPVPEVAPLTYRDGVTHLELVYELSQYLKNILHPSLQSTVDQVVADAEQLLSDANEQYVDGVQEFQRIHDRFMSDVNASLMALNDSAVSDLALDDSSLFGRVMRDVIRRTMGGETVIANDPMFGEPYTRQSVINALDYAESLGKWTKVYFPRGEYEVGEGLSLDGYSVQLIGDGAGVEFPTGEGNIPWPGVPYGTVFKASSQRGPVLDYRGWIQPVSFQGKVEHGNFSVVGSNESDPAKLNSGIAFSDISSCHFHDIAIRNTGGPGMVGHESPGNAVYLNNFSRIIVDTPRDCKVNDVPYYEFNEANGNSFHSLAIRSRDWNGVNDCGVGGAFRIVSNSKYTSRRNVWSETWIEFLHVPTNGTIFHVEGALQTFENTIFWDVYKERGATNTSYHRFLEPVIQNQEGNRVVGVIPGSGTNSEVELDYGIITEQDGLTVSGTKAYYDHHVWLKPGVKDCYIELTGSMVNSSGLGVIDDSGNTTNTILDYGRGHMFYGNSDRNTLNFQLSYGGIPNGVTDVMDIPLSGNTTATHTPGRVNRYLLTNDGGLTNPQPGTQVGEIKYMMFTQDSVGGRTIIFLSGRWNMPDIRPALKPEPNRSTVLSFMWDGTYWTQI